MIISNSRRFAFIHIHKAGGTSVEFGLDPFLSWNDVILGSTPLGEAISFHYRQRFGLDKHSSLGDLCNICGPQILENYYVFSLVRHPLDRLCSLYNFIGSLVHRWATANNVPFDGIARHIEQNPDVLKKTPALTWSTSVAFIGTSSFSEFIREKILAYDTGFHTQVSRLNLSAEGPPAADVYKLEDAQGWIPVLQRKLGVDFELPHKNQSERALVLPEQVSSDDKRHIEDHYAQDYAAFGY